MSIWNEGYGIRNAAQGKGKGHDESPKGNVGMRECGVEGCRWCAAGKEMEGRELRRERQRRRSRTRGQELLCVASCSRMQRVRNGDPESGKSASESESESESVHA